MSQLMTVMKDEIRRIARKEIKAVTAGLKKDQTIFRKAVAGLRRQTKEHRSTIRQLLRVATKQVKMATMAPEAAEGRKAWITAKGIRARRKKLKLSQAQFGKLIGVSGYTVLKWEHGSGPLKLRSRTRRAFLAIRGLGIREARLRLGA
ncbi:MAG: helix-turn-helix domain-containing protein [Verrucomicrobia bacterium]|nr:helix-turn-helix domain-containing protein [Verrucomicrobiota bacterium]MBU1735542.1 helix-turn-helix domain-containing protein [Verrucomicrobiota bacterium]MBU1858009.1 helix-turn-helix domain-containing protein [Verrucomicrobiota bacterium]